MLTKEQNRILEAVGISNLQNLLVIFKSFRQITSTLDDLEEVIKEYVDTETERFRSENERLRKLIISKLPKCPKCDTPMSISITNVEGYLSEWVCVKCGSICLNKDPIYIEMQKYELKPSRVNRVSKSDRVKLFANVEWGMQKP